jgi:AraC-like DNA-binding protein
MPRPAPELLAFRVLYDSPLVHVADYACASARGGPAAEEHSDVNTVVLMRRGAFCKHLGRTKVMADVNQTAFFSRGSTYRVSHPSDCGDRGTVFRLSPRVLNDMVRELDPDVDTRPERPFPFVTGPCEADVFWRHRALVQRLESAQAQPLEHLWADVTALQLIADVLEAAFARHSPKRAPARRRRAGTDADHAERVEAAKIYLACHLGERITLDDVASAVYASPFHLARVFQQRTGMPVHRYLTRLRLRAALERLSEGNDDLTALALELGFSSHSHFTDAFRREFGSPPSQLRPPARASALRQVRKNLEV